MTEKFATNLVHPSHGFIHVDFASMEQFCTWGALVGQVLHNNDAMLENDPFQTISHSDFFRFLYGVNEGSHSNKQCSFG